MASADTAASDITTPTEGGGETPAETKTNSSNNESKKYYKRLFRKPATTTGRPALIKQPKFEGRCEDLKGYIYDCSDARQSNIFVKTTKEIGKYVGRTFKKGSDTRLAIENLSLPVLTLPADPTEDNKTLNQIWEKEIDEYVKRKILLEDNMQTVYSLVWGQCTDVMRHKIEALDVYETISTDADGLGLLKAMKDLVYNFQSQKYLPHALHESKRRFYFCAQGRLATTSAYMEQFQNVIDVIEHSGGSIGDDPGILQGLAAEKEKDLKGMSPNELSELKKEAQEQYLAVAFLLSADRGRYGRFIEGLENDFLQGQDRYPKTITAAFSLLTNWKQTITRNNDQANDRVSFFNADDQEAEEKDMTLATDGEPKSAYNGGDQKNNYRGKHFDKAKSPAIDVDRRVTMHPNAKSTKPVNRC
jgi:hypothetical protein